MNILWAGGEDIDFPVIGGATVNTSAGTFRSGWARCSLNINEFSTVTRGNPFNRGAQTSAWITCRYYPSAIYSGSAYALVGFGLSGTNSALVIGVGNSGKTVLGTVSSGTFATLASEAGNSLSASNTLVKLDMQVTSYGATATVNIYVNGNLVINFSGNVAVAGMTNFDHVYVTSYEESSSFSEFFVADSDTRALLGVQTLAPIGAGTTTQWSNNTYTNINGTSYSDANPTYVNTTAKDQEYTVTAPTPAVFSVIGVVQSARACIPSGSTPTALKLGYGSGGVGHFGTGASKSPTVGFADYQQIDQINPITGVAWTAADLTGFQLDMQSD